MSRFNPTNLTSTYSAVAALNANFTDVATLLEKCIFRDGTSPNQMEAPFNANHFKLENVAAGTLSTDGVNLGQVVDILTPILTLSGATLPIKTRALLATVPDTGASVYLTESGVEGQFLYVATDVSSYVTADPSQNNYVPPFSDPTGASGAWARVPDMVSYLFADISKIAIPARITAFRSVGHTVAGVGAALYIEDATLTDADLLTDSSSFPPIAYGRVRVKTRNGRYFKLAEPEPTLAQLGYIHGTTSTADTVEILDTIEKWASLTTRAYRIERYPTDITIARPFRPRSYNRVRWDGIINNPTGPTGYAGIENVVKFGEGFHHFMSPGYTNHTPSYALDSAVGRSPVVSSGDASAFAAAIAVGDKVFVYTRDTFIFSAERIYAYVHPTRISAYDAGTRTITLEHPLDETRSDAMFICKTDDASVTVSGSPWSMFMLFDWQAKGDGGMRGVNSSGVPVASLFSRSAFKDVVIDLALLEGSNGPGGNLQFDSKIKFHRVRACDKGLETASSSANWECEIDEFEMYAPVTAASSCFKFGEQSRNCRVKIHSANLPFWVNPVSLMTPVRNCILEIDRLHAPLTATAVWTIGNSPITVPITGAVNNGSGLIRITSTAHGLVTGNTVFISGVTGTTEANGNWTITKITANTYDLQGSTFVNAYVSGGTGNQSSAGIAQTQPVVEDLVFRCHKTYAPVATRLLSCTAGSSAIDRVKVGGSYYNLPSMAVGGAFSTDNKVITLEPGTQISTNPGALVQVIASGVIVATFDLLRVDTEASAATDDLDTINGGWHGRRIVLKATSSARDVVVKDGTGNLKLTGDFTLNNVEDTIELIYDATASAWLELGRSDNGA